MAEGGTSLGSKNGDEFQMGRGIVQFFADGGGGLPKSPPPEKKPELLI